MRSITADELGGYQEEREALQRFERRYWPPTIAGMAFFLVGFVSLLVTRDLRFLTFVGVSATIYILVIFAMYRATPISSHTGRPMEKFRYMGDDAASLEVAYVDRDSKTYFRRVFLKRGR